MRDISDISDRYHVQSISSLTSTKRIGGYLVEAGLLTHDQINVALNDQQATGMRFGEIIVARGWLKEQTVEWIVTKVIEPERQLVEPSINSVNSVNSVPSARRSTTQPPSSVAATPAMGNSASNPNRPTVVKHPTYPPQPGSGKAADSVAEKRPEDAGLNAAERATQKSFARREVPIAKPLPSVGSPDGDVNWVG